MPRLRRPPELRGVLKMQRLRVTFSREGAAGYLSHLEMMRLWERALRRAGWRLSHSQGFNPHPKISFACPLPVGVAGEAEMLDVVLDEPLVLDEAARRLRCQMPSGIVVRVVEEVPLESPALQKLVQAGEYLTTCQAVSGSVGDLLTTAVRLLSAESLPRVRMKEGKGRSYDLRPMIRDLAVEEAAGGRMAVRMVLRIDAQGAGRPDEVLREMGIDPADCRITRVRLLIG